MKIVELHLSDVPKVTEIYQKDFQDGYSKNLLESSFLSGRFYAFGVLEKDKLVSVITASISVDEADIDGLITLKEFRKKGYAKTLVNYLTKFLTLKQVRKLFLEVREGNVSARNLYSSLNFKEISVRKKYYQDGENAVIMVKEI